MKRILLSFLLALLALTLASCSAFEGKTGKAVDTFTDDHGRACTAMKWNDSASIDCDFPEVSR